MAGLESSVLGRWSDLRRIIVCPSPVPVAITGQPDVRPRFELTRRSEIFVAESTVVAHSVPTALFKVFCCTKCRVEDVDVEGDGHHHRVHGCCYSAPPRRLDWTQGTYGICRTSPSPNSFRTMSGTPMEWWGTNLPRLQQRHRRPLLPRKKPP